jgi:hypothetical protein
MNKEQSNKTLPLPPSSETWGMEKAQAFQRTEEGPFNQEPGLV